MATSAAEGPGAAILEKLNNLSVQRLLAAKRPVMASDGKGLYLRIRDTGQASWTFRYRFAGRDVWMPLGDAKDMRLATAREDARAARVLIDRGGDPLAERRKRETEEQRKGPFAVLAERWYESEIKPRLKHPQVVRRALDKYLLPKLGRKTAQDITAGDCAALLDGVRRDHPAAANDLLRYLKALFAFARRRHIVISSPVADFSTRLDAGGAEVARERALSQDELTTLFAAIRETPTFGGDNALAIKLLLALCVRKGELFAARWDEFDLEGDETRGAVWRLPAERTKTGTAIEIPIVAMVAAWLRTLQTLAMGSPYVFPARRRDPRSRHEHVGLDTLNVAMSRLKLKIPPFTLHDLRRTARTHLAALGIRSEVAERCLNHKLRGVEGTYNQHDYFAERRNALETWTALLVEIDSGKNRVVPINGGKRHATNG